MEFGPRCESRAALPLGGIVYFKISIAINIIFLLYILLLRWRVNIKDGVIDVLCLDNYNYRRGRPDLVKKRMERHASKYGNKYRNKINYINRELKRQIIKKTKQKS